MRVITSGHSPEATRAAHRCKISASDMGAVLSRRGTAKHAALIERLVLDFEGHGLHTDEHPDPWQERHELEVTAAVAAFKALTGSAVDRVGFVEDEAFSWLGGTPHALVVPEGVLHVRCRQHVRTLRERADVIAASEYARLQTLLRVCGRRVCHVFDFWDSGAGGLYDKTRLQVIERDEAYFDATILPRCTLVWADVARTLAERRAMRGAARPA